MRGVWEAGWGKQRVLATNGPGCGTQWELAPLQSPPWVGALPGKAGRLCSMQTLPGSLTTTRFCSKAGNGLLRVPSAVGESEGSHTHRESLPQEPHVGHAVVDLRQHVLQILGRDPGSAGERGETCSEGLGWRGLTLGLEQHMHREAMPKGTSAVTQGWMCDPPE